MKFKLLPALLSVLIFASGCSSFSASQPPVRVTAKAPPKNPLAQSVPAAPKKPAPGTGTATYAIDAGPGNFKDEATMPSFHAEPLAAPGSSGPAPAIVAPGAALIPEPQLSVLPSGTASANTPVANAAADAGGVMPVNIILEDAPIPPGTSPAVIALVAEADQNGKIGNFNTAVLVMERALRIDPRNPFITYKLAQIRFKQNKIQLAEELAGKAALLAGGNLELKRKSMRLAAEAKKMQRYAPGIKDAKDKFGSSLGH